jgi:hypothetical protein
MMKNAPTEIQSVRLPFALKTKWVKVGRNCLLDVRIFAPKGNNILFKVPVIGYVCKIQCRDGVPIRINTQGHVIAIHSSEGIFYGYYESDFRSRNVIPFDQNSFDSDSFFVSTSDAGARHSGVLPKEKGDEYRNGFTTIKIA